MRPKSQLSHAIGASAVFLACQLATTAPVRGEDAASLSSRAVGILRESCYGCHGLTFKVPGYDVLNRDSLTAARKDGSPYVTPGKPDASELWNRLDDMPPKGRKLTNDERSAIEAWILAGAPFPAAPPARGFISDMQTQVAIRDHLRGLPSVDRPFQRYFNLVPLHNNPSRTDRELRLARAGVSKMLNSLSRKPTIVVPSLIGEARTLMVVDIRRLGWDNDREWMRMLRAYPYGLRFKGNAEAELREIAAEIETLLGSDVVLAEIRADWFLDAAARPALYHAIVGIPSTAQELEKELRVDVEADFLAGSLRRAAFNQSGVSRQNRLVDRHDSQLGYYWKSYDFKKTGRAINLFQFPLGPEFSTNPFPDQAFTHAGGEIIFSLPNRLQAYMLVDRDGKRIDEGPPEIVFDANDSAGSSTIINGLSCMGCHKNGMRPLPKDRVREGSALQGAPREKVDRLFAPDAEMSALVEADQSRFLSALEQAVGSFLLENSSRAPIADLPEPVIPIAKLYQADLDLAAAAAELGLKDGADLQTRIRSNPQLQRLGMNDLLRPGGTLNRAEWSTTGKGTSAFQQASSEIDRGTPLIIFQTD
ncbi:c-type cytochrome domain-containing protein [Paludisphaera rhizosphaerae]|uniref:c-type cytochrome domain-containing protein n=1 Tax=Paludisphaera rhizosphaerae TaxID=2711216 RepID=UPI0013EC741D|nr:c-type cytochrome domain-containing protein [Paludisphaera rhizosphaerae]